MFNTSIYRVVLQFHSTFPRHPVKNETFRTSTSNEHVYRADGSNDPAGSIISGLQNLSFQMSKWLNNRCL